ncbi:acyl-CoA thioesterase [Kribbella sp. NBC_01505]|uniref:acyl-CoA thioesterase n=1 Tax=Kribbella sp. NBC_01505 TaxID=2903580 RepID=UPI0038648943
MTGGRDPLLTFHGYASPRDNERGMVAARQELVFRHEVRAGDSLSIYSEIVGVGTRSLNMLHRMMRADGQLVATAEMTGVHIDLVSRQPCDLPADIRRLSGNLQASPLR